MNTLIPTFREDSFLFEGEIPDHVDDFPSVESCLGLWALFGAADGVRPIRLAVDIPNETMARELAAARAQSQGQDAEIYGYTDDVCILHPDGTIERTYIGGWVEDDED